MTLLFLALWLQMSAQQTPPSDWGNFPNGCCTMGAPVLNNDWPKNGGDTGREDHFLVEPFAQAAQRAADETDGKPPKGPLATQHNQIERGEFVEPVDVPAVQEPQTYKTGEQSCKAAPECEGKAAWTCNIVICKDETANRPLTTCADKSRILEHDENSPPKYWCRKVQP